MHGPWAAAPCTLAWAAVAEQGATAENLLFRAPQAGAGCAGRQAGTHREQHALRQGPQPAEGGWQGDDMAVAVLGVHAEGGRVQEAQNCIWPRVLEVAPGRLEHRCRRGQLLAEHAARGPHHAALHMGGRTDTCGCAGRCAGSVLRLPRRFYPALVPSHGLPRSQRKSQSASLVVANP